MKYRNTSLLQHRCERDQRAIECPHESCAVSTPYDVRLTWRFFRVQAILPLPVSKVAWIQSF